jgi:nucleoside-diphosphate-sugar epimerase
MTGTLLSLGHGYTAQALARHLLVRGWRVIGTTRDPARAAALAAEGVEPLLLAGGDIAAALAPALQEATHVLASAAPGPAGDPFLAAAGRAIAAAQPKWAGYLSTTGVYGDRGGGWVSEDDPPAPATPRGIARVAAEDAWRATGLPLHVFRLAGIYGPCRGPFARRIVKPGQVFSRIHVDDIAQVLAASIAAPRPGAVYNVCDDEPAPPEDVIAHAAALVGLPPPPEEPWETAAPGLSPMAQSFYAESKRVRNDRIRHELGVRLIHPTYREGLAAVLAAEG